MDEITDIKTRHEEWLLSLPNVTGVGIGERAGRPVIKVFVTHKLPSSELAPDELIPPGLEGHEIDVEEIGVVETETI